MGYYDLSASERKQFYNQMENEILQDLIKEKTNVIKKFSSDYDTYIRKNCYLILGKFYNTKENYKPIILSILDKLAISNNEKIRQTVVYTLGEIGKYDFNAVKNRLDNFLKDTHHSVKNGLTGAIKQIGEKNSKPVFAWVKNTLKKCNSDMEKRILHGLELRGRTHPEELLPILKDVLQNNINKKTKKMLVHIIGQISYKKGCLEKVVNEIKTWNNKEFILACKNEIIKIHKNYAKFCYLTLKEAEKYLSDNL
jgi:hypothetical protein